MPSTIINLYAGPGCGKSTSAAYLYYLMKAAGLNAELVREYVKEWAWENRKITTYDQLYFLGKQIRRETILLDRADLIVTDSPVWLGSFYAKKYAPTLVYNGVDAAISSYYKQSESEGHMHKHVVLRRSKPYINIGRYQPESEARQFDEEIAEMLVAKGIQYTYSDTNDDAIKALFAEITR